MMHREQKHRRRAVEAATLGLSSVFLLALAIAFLPLALPRAAHAETVATEQTADAQEETKDKSESVADQAVSDDQVDSETTDAKQDDSDEGVSEEKKQQEAKAEESKEADKEADNEADNSTEADNNEESKEKAEEAPKEEKMADEKPADDGPEEKSEEKPEEKSENESPSTVETERAEEIEVAPPQKEVAKPDEKKDTPDKTPKKKKCIIGATATLLEKQSELKFLARVDTGAKSCSLHVEKIKIENASQKEDIVERMTENIGKTIRFEVKNGDNKTHILTSKIATYVIIKNSNKQDGKRRYKVWLTFRWKHMEKKVLVTLNNRNHMEYPLLLGRNFLKDHFLVDVDLNSND